jgi:Ca2+-binding RTX toxin-like protein
VRQVVKGVAVAIAIGGVFLSLSEGGEGNDRLFGGSGKDSCTGGFGAIYHNRFADHIRGCETKILFGTPS